MKTLHEVIGEQLERLHKTFAEDSSVSVDEYMELTGPLHEALKILATKSDNIERNVG